MNFFAAQDRARTASRWLVIVYLAATALIVAGVTAIVGGALYAADGTGAPPDPSVLATTAILTALFIVGATLYKTAVLSSGGGKVAAAMGGTLVSPDTGDPLRRRLRNVVEEMSIASGVPVPEIYVLEQESGINAFAAGFTPGDAAIAVTRGTLELLDRDELQGVVAHEFSHILNGDMRLNIRMMGVLFGVMVLSLIGRMVLRGGYHSGLSSSRGKNAPAVMLIGVGLTLLGAIGMFFARIIKAAVSRQREFLADASAVQFTRQTEGIANALKKIGGYSRQSWFQAADPEEVSHMLFAGGIARLSALFATHPPLTERIQALDPGFRESDYPQIEARRVPADVESGQVSGFAPAAVTTASVDAITTSVGQPDPAHIQYARSLRGSIPPLLYDAAHAPEEAFLLAVALALNPGDAEQQVRLVREQLGDARAALIGDYYEALRTLGPAYRLPLLEIAFPMLKRRPLPQLEFLLRLIRRLLETDGEIDLHEYCLYRVLSAQLGQATEPSARAKGNLVGRKAARRAALDLLRIVADHSSDDPAAQDSAFAAGTRVFGEWADSYEPEHDPARTIEALDHSLDVLGRINSAGRQSMLRAVTATMLHDGRLGLAEAELLRAVCAGLDCPLPPVIGER